MTIDHNSELEKNGQADSFENGLKLSLHIIEPEVITELEKYDDGEARNRFATSALRLGILSLKYANTRNDTLEITEAGNALVAQIRELLVTRSTDLTSQLTTALTQYFDPQTGVLTHRLQSLVQKDGELERLLNTHLEGDDSVLVKSLSKYLGEHSPIFSLLSPTDANGLHAQIDTLLKQALLEQREKLLREFSLDNQDSALCRLVNELTKNQTILSTTMKEQVDVVSREFSLDLPNSALSRMINRIEASQRGISEQFSSDNEHSAVNKLTLLLHNTSLQITNSLTLDDEKSALSRLKRELQVTLDEMSQSNSLFQSEVKASLAAIGARRKEEQRSTRHGEVFEDDLGEILGLESQRLGDICFPTGSTTGAIRNCKTGDHVITLGPESSAPGAQIVWEAKEDKSYDLKKALSELEEARKNRQAQIGVFVFSIKTVPATIQPFARYGHDIIVVWDAEDTQTDLNIRAAYSVSRALAVRHSETAKETEEALSQMDLATRQIEKQLQYLDEFKRYADTIKGHGEKIADRADRMKRDLLSEVDRLDKHLHSLKAAKNLTPDDYAF
jgi:hypothetical protein